VLKEKLISLVKLSFLKKGLQSHTSCLEGEGSKDNAKCKVQSAKCKMQKFEGGRFFLSPCYIFSIDTD
jgi:hypothetical protein